MPETTETTMIDATTTTEVAMTDETETEATTNDLPSTGQVKLVRHVFHQEWGKIWGRESLGVTVDWPTPSAEHIAEAVAQSKGWTQCKGYDRRTKTMVLRPTTPKQREAMAKSLSATLAIREWLANEGVSHAQLSSFIEAAKEVFVQDDLPRDSKLQGILKVWEAAGLPAFPDHTVGASSEGKAVVAPPPASPEMAVAMQTVAEMKARLGIVAPAVVETPAPKGKRGKKAAEQPAAAVETPAPVEAPPVPKAAPASDVSDWIEDLKAEGLSSDQILSIIQRRLSRKG